MARVSRSNGLSQFKTPNLATKHDFGVPREFHHAADAAAAQAVGRGGGGHTHMRMHSSQSSSRKFMQVRVGVSARVQAHMSRD